jgi:hypothetical protein
MKKQILSFFLFASIAFFSNAQVLITNPDDLTTDVTSETVFIEKPNTEFLVYADMRLVNNSGGPIEFKFKRVRLTATSETDQLCYGEICTNAGDVQEYEWPTTLVVQDGEDVLFKPQILNVMENVFEAVHRYDVMDADDNVLASVTVDFKTVNVANIVISQLDANSINVFPNPARDVANIALPANMKATITITDALGKQVMAKSNFTGGTLNISNLKNGVYFVRIQNELLGISETIKLIIRK